MLAPPAAPIKLLQAVDASASASVALTAFSTAFRSFLVLWDGAVGSANGVALRVRISNDGGSTWLSSVGAYAYAASYTEGTAGPSRDYSTGSTEVWIMATTGLEAAGAGSVEIPYPHSTTEPKLLHYRSRMRVQSSGATIIDVSGSAAVLANTSAVSAIQFYASTGTITRGRFRLFGLK